MRAHRKARPLTILYLHLMMRPRILLLLMFSAAIGACSAGSNSATTSSTTPSTSTSLSEAERETVAGLSKSLCTSAFQLATANPPRVDEAADLIGKDGFVAGECSIDRLALATALFGGGHCELARIVDSSFKSPVCRTTAEVAQNDTKPKSLCEQAIALASDEPERAAEAVLHHELHPNECGGKEADLAETLFLAGQCEAAQKLDRAYDGPACPVNAFDRALDFLLPLGILVLAALAAAATAGRMGQSITVSGRLGSWFTSPKSRSWVKRISLAIGLFGLTGLVAMLWPDDASIAIRAIRPWRELLPGWSKVALGVAAVPVALLGMSVFRHGLEPPITIDEDAEGDGKAIAARVRVVAAGAPGGLGLVRDRGKEDIKLEDAVIKLVPSDSARLAAGALQGLRRNTDYAITGKIEGLEPENFTVRAAVYRGRSMVRHETFEAWRYGVTTERLTGEKKDKDAFVRQLLISVVAVWAVHTIEQHFFGSSRLWGTANWRSAAYTTAGAEWHSSSLNDHERDTVEKTLYSQALAEDDSNHGAHFNLGYAAADDTDTGYAEAKRQLGRTDQLLVEKQPRLDEGLIQTEIRPRRLTGSTQMVLRTRYNAIAAALNEWARVSTRSSGVNEENLETIGTLGLLRTVKEQAKAARRIQEELDRLGRSLNPTNLAALLRTGQGPQAEEAATIFESLNQVVPPRTVETLATELGEIEGALENLSATPELQLRVAADLSEQSAEAHKIAEAIRALASDIERSVLTQASKARNLEGDLQSVHSVRGFRKAATRLRTHAQSAGDISVELGGLAEEITKTLWSQAEAADDLREQLRIISRTPRLRRSVADPVKAQAASVDSIYGRLAAVHARTLQASLRESIRQAEEVSTPRFQDEGSDPIYPLFGELHQVLLQTPGIGPDKPRSPESSAPQRARLIYMDACRYAAHDHTEKIALRRLSEALSAQAVPTRWTRKDPCFYALRRDPIRARQFDALTLPTAEGIGAIYCVTDELVAAMKAFGIADRQALREAEELETLASKRDVSRELVEKAAEVARIETESWPTTRTAFTIHDANLVHESGYATVEAFAEARARKRDRSAVLDKIRKTNGSKYAWDGTYGSWSAIERLVEGETIQSP